MKHKSFKRKDGITIISLVITIVILLILAAVSISLVVGNNGVLTQASNAVVESRKAEAREDVEMAFASAETDYWTEWTKNSSIVKNRAYFQTKLPGYLNKTGTFLSIEDGEEVGTYEVKYEKFGNEYTFIVRNGKVLFDGAVASTGGSGTESSTENTTGGNGSGGTVGETEQATYTVKFNGNGGTGNMSNQDFIVGKSQELTANGFTREGYEFLGWNTDQNVTTAIYGDSANLSLSNINGDIVNLYAIWRKGGVAASAVSSSPTTYYGKTVNYSANGISNWKIFYATNSNIFLITSDYLPTDKVPNSTANSNEKNAYMATSTQDGNLYGAWWSSVPEYDGTYKQLALFKATGFSGVTESNIKCVNKLLNTRIWSDFVNGTYADYAIGSPTVEMWIESWNDMYPSDKLQYSPTDTSQTSEGYGYMVGLYGGTLSRNISDTVMKEKDGYSNTLYYPYPSAGSDVKCKGYWLASPSSNYGSQILCIKCNGKVDYDIYYRSNYWGLRPVVALKSGVTLTANTTNTGIDYNIN